MTQSLLTDTAEQVFADIEPVARGAVGEDVWSAELWAKVEEAGFPLALTYAGEEDGFAPEEALAIVRVAGANAAPVPIGEAMLGNWLLARAGLATADGPVTLAPVRRGDGPTVERRGDGVRLSGRLRAVPYARHATHLAVLVELDGAAHVARVPADACRIEEGRNLAREPRDDVVLDADLAADALGPSPVDADGLFALGAMVRSLQMAGALDTVLARTVAYAGERKQFGRPIGKFQAIQHNLAIVAGEVAAARAAADMASERLVGKDAALLAAAAKVRAGEAASRAAALCHQIHGAIGFTFEYPLHIYTQRLWAWRDEFGAEPEWAARLGAAAIAAGPQGYWSMITALDTPALDTSRPGA
ncbi:acyl-CoA dehydrogenase family protein [Acuticoccus sp.]|uniref:acyl-CoA dehydrogenase family protein n=1 Tax=Acuticoccus sp. TaxID=1904378 RepID=UPI003B52CA71